MPGIAGRRRPARPGRDQVRLARWPQRSVRHASQGTQPSQQRRSPFVSVLVSFAPIRSRSPASTLGHHGWSRTAADRRERGPALLESVLGATLRSSNLLSSATLTWGFLRAVDRQRSPLGPWSQIWSQFVLRIPFGAQLGPGISASCGTPGAAGPAPGAPRWSGHRLGGCPRPARPA